MPPCITSGLNVFDFFFSSKSAIHLSTPDFRSEEAFLGGSGGAGGVGRRGGHLAIANSQFHHPHLPYHQSTHHYYPPPPPPIMANQPFGSPPSTHNPYPSRGIRDYVSGRHHHIQMHPLDHEERYLMSHPYFMRYRLEYVCK